MNSNKKFIIGIGGLAVVVSIFVVFFVSQSNKSQSNTQNNSVETVNVVFSSLKSDFSSYSLSSRTDNTLSTPTNNNTSSSSSDLAKYKNGTYSLDVKYQSPAGSESVKINLTLADDKINTLEVIPNATDRQSIEYQNRFKNSISNQVVGKKIDELSLSRVGGASLTTNAFSSSLNNIKQSALI